MSTVIHVNVTHGSSDTTYVNIPSSSSHIFKITADDGYTFTGFDPNNATWVYYSDGAIFRNTLKDSPSISNDGKTLTFTIKTYSQKTERTLFIIAKSATPSYINLDGSVSHATITPTKFIADGTTVSSINFKADDGYKFNSNVVITEKGGIRDSSWTFHTLGKTNFDDTVTFGTGATGLTITAGSTTPLPTTIKVDTTNVDLNVTTNVKTSYTIGDNDSITVTANDGYVLDTTTLNGYNALNEWDQIGTWTISDDKKTATVSFTVPSQNVQLEVTTTKEVKPTPTVKITLIGDNWSLDGYQDGSNVPVGSTINFTFKADDNYILHNPKVSWVDNGTTMDNEATLSSNNTTATINLEVPNYPLTFTATTTENEVPVPKPVNIVYQLTNVTATPKPTTINNAESINFNFDPDNGYHLLNDGSMVQYNALNEIIQSDIIQVTNTTGKTAHLTVANGVDRVVITLEAVKTDINVVNIDYHLSHATGDVKTFPSNSTSLKLTLTADDGYIFNRDGTITLITILESKEFTIDANNTNSVTTTIDWSNTVPHNEVQTAIVSMEANINESQSGGGYANIYNVTPIEMNSLATEVLYKITSNGAEIVNQNDFIRAYYRIPFKIDRSQLFYPETFKLGNYKSTTTTHQVKNDIQTWDLGTITIKEKYHNAYDYSNVTITLFLPFMNSVNLDPEKVIEIPLRIEYVMDMYTGMTTANIYNPDGDVIQSVQDKLSTDLPIIQADTNKVGLGIRNPILNNLDTAYVVVSRHIPVKNAITYPTLESGILNTYTGNITASDITLPDTIKKAEREQITQLLKEGITIVK